MADLVSAIMNFVAGLLGGGATERVAAWLGRGRASAKPRASRIFEVRASTKRVMDSAVLVLRDVASGQDPSVTADTVEVTTRRDLKTLGEVVSVRVAGTGSGTRVAVSSRPCTVLLFDWGRNRRLVEEVSERLARLDEVDREISGDLSAGT